MAAFVDFVIDKDEIFADMIPGAVLVRRALGLADLLGGDSGLERFVMVKRLRS